MVCYTHGSATTHAAHALYKGAIAVQIFLFWIASFDERCASPHRGRSEFVAECSHLRCLPATCSRSPVLPGGRGTSGSGVPALLLPWRDRRAVPPARQRARLGRTCRPPAPRALQRASDCAPSHHGPPAPLRRVHVSLCRRKRRRKPKRKRRVAVALTDTADAAGAALEALQLLQATVRGWQTLWQPCYEAVAQWLAGCPVGAAFRLVPLVHG